MFDIAILYVNGFVALKASGALNPPGVTVFFVASEAVFFPSNLSSTGLFYYLVLSSAADVLLHELIITITTRNGSEIWTRAIFMDRLLAHSALNCTQVSCLCRRGIMEMTRTPWPTRSPGWQ
jgi:hypothetical protein